MRLPLTTLILFALCSNTFADTFVKHPKRFRVGPNPTSVVAADLTGDGLPEILTSNRGRLADIREERPAEDLLSYLVATDVLVYTSEPQLRSGFGPYEIVIANIDALKAPDVIVANFLAVRDRDITYLRNISEGLFEPHHFSIPDDQLEYTKQRDGEGHPIFSTPGLTSIAVEDFDGDGLRDCVAVGWTSDILAYFPGDAEHYFGTPTLTPLPGGPRDITLGDLDGDGNTDLIVTLYSTNEIVLLKGDGEGGFTVVERRNTHAKLPHKTLWADINGDGDKDIVVSHAHSDDSIGLFYGTGSFSFPVSQEVVLGKNRQQREYEIRDLKAGDFNQDGRMDLAVACHTAGSVVLLLNDSTGSAAPVKFDKETYSFDKGKPYALCVHDFNLDDKPDIAVALWETNSVEILLAR